MMTSRIFKYLSPDRIDVLRNMSIRFTQAGYLNDPFESMPFISKLMSEAESHAFYKNSIYPILNEIGDRKITISDIPEEYRGQVPKELVDIITSVTIKEGLEIIPAFHPLSLIHTVFSIPMENFKYNIAEKLKSSWNKYFGVLCLSEVHNNITMWSHYAQNHEGFVIEFNPDSEFFNKKRHPYDPLGYLREVEYKYERPEIDLISYQKSENEFLESIAANIFYTKSKHWANEKEIRLIYNLKNSDNKLELNGQDIYLFHLPPDAIKTIFIGVNATDRFKEDVIRTLEIKEYSHVEIKYGVLDLKNYKINFI